MMKPFSVYESLETETHAAHHLMQILAACSEAVVEFHIHQSDIRFHTKVEMTPLIHNARLKAYVEVLNLGPAVERT